MRYVLYRTDVKYIRIMHIREVKKHRKALFMLYASNVISLYVSLYVRSIWVVLG